MNNNDDCNFDPIDLYVVLDKSDGDIKVVYVCSSYEEACINSYNIIERSIQGPIKYNYNNFNLDYIDVYVVLNKSNNDIKVNYVCSNYEEACLKSYNIIERSIQGPIKYNYPLYDDFDKFLLNLKSSW